MSPTEDRGLIRRTLDGDRTAFDAFYRAHYPQVYAMIARRVADRDLILDLIQTTFLCAYRSLKTYRGDAAFSTWLTQIALNVYKSYLRAQRVRQTWVHETEDPERVAGIDREPAPCENPEHEMQQKERRKLVIKGIRSLPVRYRKAVWLRYFRNWSHEEITQALQVPMATVKTWLCRGRRQLKGEFHKLGLHAV